LDLDLRMLGRADLMTVLVFDTNCFIAATHPGEPSSAAVVELIEAARVHIVEVRVSMHTLCELESGAAKHGTAALDLARAFDRVPYFPVGSYKELLGSINDLAGTWDDAKGNERLQQLIADQLANAGSGLRDRGAFVDALRARATFVTSDKQLVAVRPASRIFEATGIRPITPETAVETFLRKASMPVSVAEHPSGE
jgi:predicted nucleic acid-binding protein